MASVRLDTLRKVYDNGYVAVQGASFTVADGELLVLVGPSGCGKTTLLRMIAGLEAISGGTLRIGERVVNEVAPKDRDIAMVFQSYALYPHMSVAENLAFGLKLRGQPRAEIERRVAEAAEVLGLDAMLAQRPGQLSGGQRQRVALGRALVREPAVFLLDEPLSNLDAKLRLAMRVEIARLHRKLGATMVYVTHDQIEAMTLGQRIVVLDGGVVQQIDTPMALYDKPANLFVAGFIGSPAMNVLRGRLQFDGAAARLDLGTGTGTGTGEVLPLGNLPPALRACDGRDLAVGLRPEALRPAAGDAASAQPQWQAQLEVVEPVGNEVFLNLRLAGHELVARVAPQPLPERGSNMALAFDPAALHFFDAATGLRIDTSAAVE
ncbi:MAG TPA: sn-glycerol-3-phosphate ABC transporter ATP-binding protein UgpC [Rhodanobacteraceae bacterium]|nr:sn-glycerol-3-phosphate ABC transporter ATP-binding protein UgpC [Rhodanobacteraceae bacterium]